MPSIITDDMVKEMCKMSRPIPIQAIGILDPNRKVGAKPNFIRKRGRTGIKPVELPIYAPASINGLVQSICNITKLEPEVVENYLDNTISQELGEYTGAKKEVPITMDYLGFDNEFDQAVEPVMSTSSSQEPPVELLDSETQTRGAGRPPRDEKTIIAGEFESVGDVEVEYSKGTANVGEDTVRPAGRPPASSMITPTPRLRGSSRRADGEPEL